VRSNSNNLNSKKKKPVVGMPEVRLFEDKPVHVHTATQIDPSKSLDITKL